jgi:adenosylhomocysteine nucleosidase
MKVFVIAMQSEAETVLAHLENKTQTEVCGKKITYGTLFGEAVGVVTFGVGKVNAACAAQYAISQMYADTLINIGVAGGLNKSMQVGKVYAIDKAVEYDFDLVQLNHTPIGTLNEFDDRYLPLKKVKGYTAKVLATGDRFNDSKADFELLTKDIKADIRDMEGAAIVHAAIHAKVPVYAFKCISDIAGSGSTTEQFEANMQLCQKNLTDEIPRIWEAIHG